MLGERLVETGARADAGAEGGPPPTAVRTRRQVLRRCAGTAAAACVAAALAACGPLRRAEPLAVRVDGPPVDLLLWGPPPDNEPGTTLQNLLVDLRQQQPRLTVRLEPILAAGVDVTKAVAAIAAGTGPDIFYLGRWLTAQFAARKAIGSVEQSAKRATNRLPLSDYYPRLVAESRWRGELYGIPYVSDTRGLYFNRAHFREAGLPVDKPPPTWDEFDQAAARLARRGADGQPERLGYVPGWGNPPTYLAWFVYLWQLGGELLAPDNRKTAPDLPRFGAAALEKMVDQLRRAGGFSAAQALATGLPQGTDQFSAGRVSMIYATNGARRIYDRVPGLDYAIATFPLAPNGKRVNYAAGPNLALSASAKQPDAAWRVVEYLETPAQLLRFNAAANTIPPRRSVATSKEYLDLSPHNKFFVDEMPYGRWVPIVPGITDIFTLLEEMYQPAIQGKVSPRDAVQEMIPKIQRILNENAAYL